MNKNVKSTIIGNKIYTIVKSKLSNEYICLYDAYTNTYLRHRNGILIQNEIDTSKLFLYDSSFKMIIKDNRAKFYCSNPGFEEYCISQTECMVIISKENKFINTFAVLNSSVVTHDDKSFDDSTILQFYILNEKINTLSERFAYFFDLYKLNNPTSNVPKAVGNLRTFQEGGIKLLKIFDEICLKYKISYWIDYGTLLGAARHNGYIPWDDDIDVCMLIDDFTKFSSVIDAELENSQIIFTHSFYPRIYKLKTSNKPGSPWIDIFPFYYLDNKFTKEDFANSFKLARVERKKIIQSHADCSELVRNFSLKFNNKFASETPTDTIFRGFQAADHPLCDVLLVNDIFPLKKINFEGMLLMAPNKIHLRLKNRYGNYLDYPKSFDSHIKH